MRNSIEGELYLFSLLQLCFNILASLIYFFPWTLGFEVLARFVKLGFSKKLNGINHLNEV